MAIYTTRHKIFIAILAMAILVVAIFALSQRQKPVVAGIVPHHLVAKDLIEDFFVRLKKNPPKTLLLVSPDHFNRIPAPIVTGRIGISDERIIKLLQSQGVMESSSDIGKEHGITNLVPFIQRIMPRTRIVPVLVSEHSGIPLLDRIAKVLAATTDDSVFFLASEDFSHHLQKNATLFHDIRSIGVVSSFDEKFFPNLETDLWQTLYLVRKIAYLKGANDWELIAHRNTSDYLQGLIEDNVGYVTAFLRKGDGEARARPVSLLFFGNMDLEFIKRNLKTDRFLPFKKIHHFMTGVDIVTAYTTEKNIPTEIEELLKAVDLSKKELTVGTERIAFLNYSLLEPKFNLRTALSEIRSVSAKNTFTIVQLEWKEPSQIIAKEMIDAGADTIIGSGPSEGRQDDTKPYELYNDKPIFYSLGDFIGEDGSPEGLAVGIVLEPQQIRYFLFELILKNGQPKLSLASPKTVIFTIPRTYSSNE